MTEHINPHKPVLVVAIDTPSGVTEVRHARCDAEGCDFTMYAGTQPGDLYDKLFFRQHASQYEPGRAPSIEVDWEISATCSVCEGGGSIVVSDSESIECLDCGTTWAMDGSFGERDDSEEARR